MILLAALVFGALAAAPPHVLFVIVDDFGWANVGFHSQNNPEVVTPTINRLAQQGIELNRHYVHMMCTPTRSSFQSGRLPVHVQLTLSSPCVLTSGMTRNMTGIAEHLTAGGYSSHIVGKYDAGMASPKQTPSGRGYNSSLIYFGHGNWGYTELEWLGSSSYNPLVPPLPGSGINDYWDTNHPASALNGTGYEEDNFRDRITNIIQAHDPNTPLFLLYTPKLVHYPLQAPLAYQQKFSFITEPHRQMYSAMVNFLDDQIANITAQLVAKGMWDNTLMVLTADNGGYVGAIEPCDPKSNNGLECFAGEAGANNFPHRGGKYSDFEGGIRANAFVSGGFLPSSVRGTVLNEIIHVADWYATLAGLAGQDPTDREAAKYNLPPIDSLDMWPLLSGQVTKSPRETILVTSDVLVSGNYKVITGQAAGAGWSGVQYPNTSSAGHEADLPTLDCSKGCLFDVVNDPAETVDLAASQPALLQQLLALKAQQSKTIWPGAHATSCTRPAECLVEDKMAATDACTAAAVNKYGGFYGPFLPE